MKQLFFAITLLATSSLAVASDLPCFYKITTAKYVNLKDVAVVAVWNGDQVVVSSIHGTLASVTVDEAKATAYVEAIIHKIMACK